MKPLRIELVDYIAQEYLDDGTILNFLEKQLRKYEIPYQVHDWINCDYITISIDMYKMIENTDHLTLLICIFELLEEEEHE